jgi:hypothetical protein
MKRRHNLLRSKLHAEGERSTPRKHGPLQPVRKGSVQGRIGRRVGVQRRLENKVDQRRGLGAERYGHHNHRPSKAKPEIAIEAAPPGELNSSGFVSITPRILRIVLCPPMRL